MSISIRNRLKISAALSIAALAAVQSVGIKPVAATQLQWNTNTSGTPVDGSGTWNTSTAHWYNGTNDVDWTNGDAAIFGYATVTGAGSYSVTTGANVTAAGLVFNGETGENSSSGLYTIYTSSSDVLTLGSGAYINVFPNAVSNTHNSATISGTNGLATVGASTITINGEGSYSTGSTSTAGGGFELASANSGVAAPIDLTNDVRLQENTSGAAGTSAITVSAGTGVYLSFSGGTTASSTCANAFTLSGNGWAADDLADTNTNAGGRYGTVRINHGIDLTGNITLSAAASIYGNGSSTSPNEISGIVTDGGNVLTLAGSYTILAGNTGTAWGAGGGLVVDTSDHSTGFVIAAVANALGQETLTLGSSLGFGTYGEIALDSNNETVTELSTASTSSIISNNSSTTGTATLTFGDNTNQTFAGTLLDVAPTGTSAGMFDQTNYTTNGKLAIVKNGSGTEVFTGNNTYSGGTTINAGTLQIGNNSSGTLGGGAVTDNATLAFDLSLNTSTVSNSISTTSSGLVEMIGTSTLTISSGLAGALSTQVNTAAGTLKLTGAETYTGTTTVSAGTLQISGANTDSLSGTVSGAGNLTVGDGSTATKLTLSNTGNNQSGNLTINTPGGTLAATGTLGATTLSAGTFETYGTTNSQSGSLTLASLTGSGGTLQFNLGQGSNYDMITVSGAASGIGNGGTAVNINVIPGATPTSGENVAVLTAVTSLSTTAVPSDDGALYYFNSANSRLILAAYQGGATLSGALGTAVGAGEGTNPLSIYAYSAGGPATLYWNDAYGDQMWNIQSSANWDDITYSNPADVFYQGDNVNFDTAHNGSGHYSVTLNTSVAPSSITVNGTNPYTISGTGLITGNTGISIGGAGTPGALTLSNTGTNAYTGTTAINDGTLTLGAAGAMSANTSVTFGDGSGDSGTLDLAGQSATVAGLAVNGGTNNTITSSDAGGSLTFAGGTSTFSGVISGTNLALTVASGSLTLSGNESYGGATLINGGTLGISGTDNNTGGTTINASGILNVSGTVDGSITDSGTLDATSAAASVANLTGTGAAVITAGDTLTLNPTANDTFAGSISDTAASGNLAVNAGTSRQTLSGTNTFRGTTTVNSGTVVAANSNSFGSTTGGAVTINTGTTLDLSGNTNSTLNFGAKTFNIAGTGVSGAAGAIENNSGQQLSAFENITLTANATIGGTGRIDMGRVGTGALNLSSYTLTDAITTDFGFDDYAVVEGTGGNIVVTAGDLTIQSAEVVSSANDPGGAIIYDGTSATPVIAGFYHTAGTITLPMYFNGAYNTLRQDDNNVNSTIGSNMYLNNLVTVNPNNAGTGAGSLTLTGNISDVTAATALVNPIAVAAGAGSILVKPGGTGTGTLTLEGANDTYSGGTTVDQLGILVSGAANAFGSGSLTVNGGTAELNGNTQSITDLTGTGGTVENGGTGTAALTMNQTNNDTYSGAITDGSSGSLALTDNNGGFNQVLSGPLSYSGNTTLNGGGTLIISGANTDVLSGSIVDNGTDDLTVGDGTHATNLTVNGSVTVNGAITVNTGSSLTDGLTTPYMTNDGQWNVQGASSVDDLNGSGQVDMEANLTVAPLAADALTGATNITGTNGSAELIVDGSNGGSLTLDGANTYAGTTDIRNDGYLALGASGAISSPTITVEGGSTFDVSQVSGGFTLGASAAQELDGNGTVNGNLTVGPDGNLSPGDAVGPMYVSGSVALDGTLSLQVDPDVSGMNDELIATGSVTEGGTLDVTSTNGDPFTGGEVYTLINANSFFDVFANIELPTLGPGQSWLVTQTSNELNIAVETPEPASLGLIALGAMSLLMRGRKKKRPDH